MQGIVKRKILKLLSFDVFSIIGKETIVIKLNEHWSWCRRVIHK